MRVCLYEERTDFFEPLSLTRPVFDFRCGLYPLGERLWQRLGASERGVLVRPYLAELYRQQHPNVAVNDWNWLAEGPVALVNGLWLPEDEPIALSDGPAVGLVGDEIAFVLTGREQMRPLAAENFEATLAEFRHAMPCRPVGGAIVHFPWELVDHNGAQIGRDLVGPLGDPFDVLMTPLPMALTGPSDRLRLHPSARIEPFVAVDATRGPVVIDDGAVITSFTRLEGPCYVGKHTQVFGAKIRAGTTLGPHCRIGGEVEGAIVHGHSNKYHDGFLGHAYVGEWVNLGAGTSNSDLRNDYGPVSVIMGRQKIATRRTKVGCFLGDHVKTGLGTLINTGSNIGAFANLLPAGRFAPRHVPPFANFVHGDLTEGFPLETLLATAQEMMHRRQCELTAAHRRLYAHLFTATAADRQRALRDALQRQARIA
jgi:UDP-N-acetylglucosamine diphosphorylase / glucose-1-phosphate thymidylyltransferase / UDP-N-acetylgalactosamine diphosphorylase / glucosamine-1-phosphate N-acetyltransferase / galactosamine-1-phosphate N-acetyltransferase